MKQMNARRPLLRARLMKLLCPVLGLGGLWLRQVLLASLDDKGLFPAGHPAWLCLWGLLLAGSGLILLTVRPIRGPGSHRAAFPTSLPAFLGSVLMAAAAGLGAFTRYHNGQLLFAAASALAAVCLLAAAVCRMLDRKPFFLLHVGACLYFALELLRLYQSWSFDPQIQHYCFQLFACIALTLTAYNLARFDNGSGSHRALWGWGLAAVFLCCVCLDSGFFFAAGALWAFTGLSNLRRPHRYLRRRRQKTSDMP